MSHFFIKRPILAWVIAIVIVLAGAYALTRLPISRYPDIAPPAVDIEASYPGASAETVEESVTQIVEQNVTGLEGLRDIVSTSDRYGNVTVSLTFVAGTDLDIAHVQTQNKLQQAIPLLPQIVQQQGISVSKTSGARQLVVAFVAADGSALRTDEIDDFVATTVYDALSRVPGVGAVQLFGSKRAMRIWLDADKLTAYKLTPSDVAAAIRAQNSQASIGQLGDTPSVQGQQLNASVIALGRLRTAEQFRNIVLRNATGSGAALRLSDVARVELGRADYSRLARYNGKPTSGIGITLANGANSLRMVEGVKAELARLKPQMPRGLSAVYPFDTSPYVRLSILGVVETLLVAIGLVFVVMFVFLQDIRATLIPTVAVPVVLLGTCIVMAVVGLSINMLTMFAVVLAIGLLVDDAIIVVENVERLMQEEGLSPVEATSRSMRQITGALIGIASVLAVIFVPMSFLEGSAGVIYRQFSITIVSAMVLSVVVAIVLTPALCATVLKPYDAAAHNRHRGFFRWFNDRFERFGRRYEGLSAAIVRRPLRWIALYLALSAVMIGLFFRLPTGFLPAEDQGYLLTMVQGPVGATQGRTLKVLDQVENIFLHDERAAVQSTFTVAGSNFSGKGQNAGFGFIQLRDWSERKSSAQAVTAVQGRAMARLSKIQDARVFAFAPPPVVQLSTSAGFDFYLQDSYGQGHKALLAARERFLTLAEKSKLLSNVRANGQDDTPQLYIDIDPQKVASLGLSMSDVEDMLSVAWGGRYIDDFVDKGRVKRVVLQADAPFRMRPEDFGRWHVRNGDGEMVSVSAFASSRWEYGPPQLERYNGVSATNINGESVPGVSTGEAMQEVERLVAQLPPGFAAEFVGQSFEEREAVAQAPWLYALSLLVVFLWLAALYESWSMPAAVLLVVPLGIIGVVLASVLRGMERDVYFQVAVLTTVGLTSKNAILIVEFAKQRVEQGMPLIEAAVSAAHSRLRPILMTSLAFGFGVLPLAVATGAGAGAQRAIGTGVFGGMLAGTFLGLFFIPLFFVLVQRVFHSFHRREAGAAADAE
ncbi:efflux RND transporter permease subunit [Lysobacter sp. K5869]|uniref:efflux RND transporter permease subunit n=1 Tax=Lysobacter sp. K5869 TaxID=2820808 RepID=UPI001C0615E9|nr:efflux RND transporter permease subunit [Lysobacter sp. K5869]QWP77554.1 efflux RND transporter permease subunit [Lysobacter sp. K5869]